MNSLGTTLLTSCFILSISTTVSAEKLDAVAIVKQGNGRGAVACIACHGQQGEGNPALGYPYLAGLPANYLRNQLHAFQNGSRENAVMKPISSQLSDAEIAAVADYYASLEKNESNVKVNSKLSNDDHGAKLAMNGKWSEGMPACFQCHGEKGEGIAPHFPAIAGQSFAYIKNQLQDWQNGKRKNDPLGLMQSVAKSMDQQEIDAVARFLSSQQN